ncbi:hypothetical protein HMPREF0262_03299 [Clostridium sp. ATCC 29733]|nr:hypothetical protein HMPREF0262_03299 [Clostridium sp. ATCC 29733]
MFDLLQPFIILQVCNWKVVSSHQLQTSPARGRRERAVRRSPYPPCFEKSGF